MRDLALAERVRCACVNAALAGYEDAGLSGLCREGAWEAAISAIAKLDLTTLLNNASRADLSSAQKLVKLPNAAPKLEWRRWAERTRAELATTQLSSAIVEHIRSWPIYQRAEHVLIYLAFGTEINLAALHDDSKTFHTTRTWGRKKGLTIHPLGAGLEQHPYGYWQPVAGAASSPAEQIELVLVPGLCFDQRGTRIGYGAGYYDRLLPGLHPDVPRIGVTADVLVVPALPAESHDILMTQLVTETGVKQVAC